MFIIILLTAFIFDRIRNAIEPENEFLAITILLLLTYCANALTLPGFFLILKYCQTIGTDEYNSKEDVYQSVQEPETHEDTLKEEKKTSQFETFKKSQNNPISSEDLNA